MNKFMSFLKDEDGQGMVEYALIIAVVVVVVLILVGVIKGPLANKINESKNTINNATVN